MTISRRSFLRTGGLSAAAMMLASCSQVGREFSRRDLPESLNVPAATAPIIRMLNRAGYGPRPGDLERASQLGLAAYLEEQLNPAAITDTTCDVALRNLTYYPMDITQLLAQEARDVAYDFGQSTISRALYSKRQLYESMVEFWTDHFNIYLQKNKHMLFLKVVDDRDVIRPHALGKFRDLLWASAHSPAMLVYLDNVENTKAAPNENYARELMELHTLGVHGGYTQQDVQELSRALTGWDVRRRGRQQGQFFFNVDQHDDGVKTILGVQLVAGQGQRDVEQMLEVLVTHPMTAQFIAFKLVRRFVADVPPKALIERVAAVYISTDGDIKSMLREIFLSAEFADAPPKLKRPYTYMISTLRSMGVDLGPKALKAMAEWLNRMGQPLYQWPPPDGYPDTAPAWASNLLPRWNFALNLLSNQIEGAHVPFDGVLEATHTGDVGSALNAFASLTLGHPLDEAAAGLFGGYVGAGRPTDAITKQRLGEAVSLMLASPAFQWT